MIILQDDYDELHLEHYGTPGMKWGVRKDGRRADGKLTRTRQAVINQNDRAVTGISRRYDKRQARTGKTAANSRLQRARVNRIDQLTAQTERIKSGKLWMEDRARIYNTISLYDLMSAYDRPDLA